MNKKDGFRIDYDFNENNIKCFYGYGAQSKMASKYFSFQKKYLETPYLQSLKIVTKSDINLSFFDIIIYAPNHQGIPTYVLNSSIIRCIVSKGINENMVDIVNHQIKFPVCGLFIVINWINTKKNRSDFNYHKGGCKEKRYNGYQLQPAIGLYPCLESDTYLLKDKGWELVRKSKSLIKDYDNKYLNLAIELKLTSCK